MEDTEKTKMKSGRTNPPQGLPGDPVAKTLSSQCRGPGIDPWLGNMLQLTVHMLELKTPCATTKTQCSKKKKKVCKKKEKENE